MRNQIFGDGAEVGVVRSHHDGNPELRRFQRVVAAGRHQAAADKGHCRKRINRGQFADGVEQQNLAGP